MLHKRVLLLILAVDGDGGTDFRPQGLLSQSWPLFLIAVFECRRLQGLLSTTCHTTL
jgi:hypothetical protein